MFHSTNLTGSAYSSKSQPFTDRLFQTIAVTLLTTAHLVTYGGQQLLKTDARSGLQQKRVASVSSTPSPKPFNGGPLCPLTDQTKCKSHIPPPLKECYSKSNAYPCYTVD